VPVAAAQSTVARPIGQPGDPPTAPLPPPPGRTTLVSQRAGGGFPNAASAEPSISADGRYVAFASSASNIAGGGGASQAPVPAVLVRDRQRGTTIRLPLAPGFQGGGQARDPSISADGNVVAFTYQPPQGFTAIGSFVLAWDRSTGKTQVVSRNTKGGPADRSREPSVSATGRFVSFTSENGAMAAGDETNADIFRYDRRRNQTVLVSVGFNGGPTSATNGASSISADGNLVAFVSDGGDAIVNANTGSGNQVYVRDLRAERTEEVSVARGGPPNGASGAPAISADGNAVAFESAASNLVPADGNGAPDVFRRDRGAGATLLVSVNVDGQAAGGLSRLPAISADGRMVAFQSTAPDLSSAGAIVPDAHLAASIPTPLTEVFERDIVAGQTVLVSVARNGGPGGKPSLMATVGGNGRFVAFASLATTLVANDRLGNADVFLRDMPPAPRLNPGALEFGSRAVGSPPAPAAAATLVNTGWGPLAVRAATITGSARSDYDVVADACVGRLLHRQDACTVSVQFAPTRRGSRPASLAVPYAFAGSPRTAALRGSGSQAKLQIDPDIGPPGTVVIATGTGFPPNTQLRLSWLHGLTPKMPVIKTDARGRFRIQVLVFHNDLTGPRDLRAAAVNPDAFPPISTTMLVTRPSVAPPGFLIIRRVIDLPLMLLIRG
jgi:Tol biopolymer transport system component